jgi:hypothetical protein
VCQWPKTVVVEIDQSLGAMNVVDVRGTHDHKADADKARGKRNQEPVADVRHDLALTPPGTAGVAGRPVSQNSEHDAKGD